MISITTDGMHVINRHTVRSLHSYRSLQLALCESDGPSHTQTISAPHFVQASLKLTLGQRMVCIKHLLFEIVLMSMPAEIRSLTMSFRFRCLTCLWTITYAPVHVCRVQVYAWPYGLRNSVPWSTYICCLASSTLLYWVFTWSGLVSFDIIMYILTHRSSTHWVGSRFHWFTHWTQLLPEVALNDMYMLPSIPFRIPACVPAQGCEWGSPRHSIGCWQLGLDLSKGLLPTRWHCCFRLCTRIPQHFTSLWGSWFVRLLCRQLCGIYAAYSNQVYYPSSSSELCTRVWKPSAIASIDTSII